MTYYDAEEVGNKPSYDKSLETKATCAVAGVVDDVKDILGVKKVSYFSTSAGGCLYLVFTFLIQKDLNRCRAWIRKQVDSD